ncbi:FtsH-binding integral membrane protein [Lactobacillus colini]|uniref:FtsH-binding integral membrane protein n=1 Tax=Lactobacillus colini TaxID=1819254 RepID=A0ABS4MGJ8_9LACO|nr:Bax inhibitor-1/YccA family protein [Lactobacillus colini]MBP2058444.1 FtsH-binding integral membrane protein [Lactobacillus colini]
MDNFEPERRHVVDISGLNSFLSKMYGMMTLAVLVSAISAYLTMTVFRTQVLTFFANNRAISWVILIVPLFLALGIGFRATRNPVASFIMLMALSLIYGIEFALIAGAYTQTSIASAFFSTAAVFITMAVIGTTTKKNLNNIGSYASAALIGLIVAMLINLFLRNPMVSYVFSFIAVIIFTILTAWDAQKMKQIYLQYGNDISANGLAIAGALELYLDFVNLFLQFLQIFGFSNKD